MSLAEKIYRRALVAGPQFIEQNRELLEALEQRLEAPASSLWALCPKT